MNPLIFSEPWQLTLDKDLTPVSEFFHDILSPAPEEDD